MNNLKTNNFWKGKNVFITGHTGFKGSWLCLLLKYLGANVTGYSLKPLNKKNLFSEAKIKNLINKSIIADIRNKNKLFSELKKSKANIVFHLAAQALVIESYLNPIDTFKTNIIGTANILDCISKINSINSSVIITSDKVYDIKKNKIFKESDLLGGIDPYSASKVCSEHVFLAYVNSFFKNSRKRSIATARAGNVIGGGDYSKDRLIPDIIKSVKLKRKILIRNPKSIRPWQHVLDPISGYINLAEKLYKNRFSQTHSWNFGPNVQNCKTVKYIANKIAYKTNSKIKIIKEKTNLFKETVLLRLDNRKAKKMLKWYPKWSLDYSIQTILDWNFKNPGMNKQKVCFNQIKDYLT